MFRQGGIFVPLLRGGIMISSPCKNCPRINLPKEDCMKDCRLLRELQDVLVLAEKNCVSSGIDCTEENRYTISLSLTKTSAAFWTT
jgi:hypothetical protein